MGETNIQGSASAQFTLPSPPLESSRSGSLQLSAHRTNSSAVSTPSKETTAVSVGTSSAPANPTSTEQQLPRITPYTPQQGAPADQLSPLEKESKDALTALNRLKPPKKKLELQQIKAGVDHTRNATKAAGNAATLVSTVPVAVILTPITAPLGAIGQGIEWLRRRKDKATQKDHILQTLVKEYNKNLPENVKPLSDKDIEKAQAHLEHELNDLYNELDRDLEEYRALSQSEQVIHPKDQEAIQGKKNVLENKWANKGIDKKTITELAAKNGNLDTEAKSEVAQKHIQHLANQTWQALFQGALSKANLEMLTAQGHVNQAGLLASIATAQALVTVPLAIAIVAGATSAQPLAPVNLAFLALSLSVAGAGLYYLHRTRPNAFRQTLSTPKRVYFQARQKLASMKTAISRASTKKKAIEARYKQIALLELQHGQSGQRVEIGSKSGRAKIEKFKKNFQGSPDLDGELSNWKREADRLDRKLSRLEEGINTWKGKVKELKQEMVKAKFADNVRLQYKVNPMKDNIKGFTEVALELYHTPKNLETRIAFNTYLAKMGIDVGEFEKLSETDQRSLLMKLGREAEVTNQEIIDLVKITAKEGEPIPPSVRNFMKREMKMSGKIEEKYTAEILEKFNNLSDPFAIKNTAENLLKVDPTLTNPATLAMFRLLKINPDKISPDLQSRQSDLEIALKNFFGMSHDDFVRFVTILQEEQKKAQT